MGNTSTVPSWKDKILFTPGPLTTSRTVKQAMLRDLGSRDFEMIGIIREIRDGLVAVGGATPDQYTTVLLQGAGTYALEAVVGCGTDPDGKVMVIINGAYGKRIAKIAETLKIPCVPLEFPENETADPAVVKKALADHPDVTLVSATHCETTTGIINPIQDIGAVVAAAGAKYFVDAMSSFGAVPLSLTDCHIDYIVSSANKCIEGVPGFSYVVCRIETLKQTAGWARSMSFDLLAQYEGFETNGQFRFTPPTSALVAFHQALRELEAEGGPAGRGRRYKANYDVLVAGMRAMGFKEYLPVEDQGYIITSFLFPTDPKFDFETFYEKLNQRNYVIYPGKVSDADCFRIGNIGRIFESDVKDLLAAIRDVMDEMGFTP